MEYRKYGKRYVIRIDRGEEVTAKLQELCEKEDIRLASVEGLGAADHVVVGLYNVEKKKYKKRVFDEEMEISSLIGNITMQGKKVYHHIHVTVCNADLQAFGGHLNECRISGTCELFLTVLDGQVGRKYDDVTGLNLFDFSGRYIEICSVFSDPE